MINTLKQKLKLGWNAARRPMLRLVGLVFVSCVRRLVCRILQGLRASLDRASSSSPHLEQIDTRQVKPNTGVQVSAPHLPLMVAQSCPESGASSLDQPRVEYSQTDSFGSEMQGDHSHTEGKRQPWPPQCCCDTTANEDSLPSDAIVQGHLKIHRQGRVYYPRCLSWWGSSVREWIDEPMTEKEIAESAFLLLPNVKVLVIR